MTEILKNQTANPLGITNIKKSREQIEKARKELGKQQDRLNDELRSIIMVDAECLYKKTKELLPDNITFTGVMLATLEGDVTFNAIKNVTLKVLTNHIVSNPELETAEESKQNLSKQEDQTKTQKIAKQVLEILNKKTNGESLEWITLPQETVDNNRLLA
jgi:hypothetical protein